MSDRLREIVGRLARFDYDGFDESSLASPAYDEISALVDDARAALAEPSADTPKHVHDLRCVLFPEDHVGRCPMPVDEPSADTPAKTPEARRARIRELERSNHRAGRHAGRRVETCTLCAESER